MLEEQKRYHIPVKCPGGSLPVRAGDLGRSLMSGDRGLSAYVSWGGASEDGVEINVSACKSNYDESV